MTFEHEQVRSCPRGLAEAPRPRLPLQERPNPPTLPLRPPAPPKKLSTESKKSAFLGPVKSTPPKENSLPRFPCSKDPVPDSWIDFTELWKAVSMAKKSDKAESNQAASTKGTEAYNNVLYLLGIDINTVNPRGDPRDVIDLANFQLPQTVQYPNLRTDEELQALANRHKNLTTGLNEATFADHIRRNLFILDDIPERDSSERSCVPCQILEFPSAFTSYDRFNNDLYTFVRGAKKERVPQPHESDLRSRSDLTFMAYMNAVGVSSRNYCVDFPGVHNQYNAIAPFLSIEFKVSNEPAKMREAIHQIAISSFVNLVERQRLPRPPESPYIKDEKIRHYAYTICGNQVTVWRTTLQLEEKYRRSYTTYQVQKLQVLDLAIKCHLEEFLQWHQHIMTWGLVVYVPEYLLDLERVMGAPRRDSLVAMVLSAKKVTQPISFDGSSNVDNEEPDDEADPATEDQVTEYQTTEDPATEHLAIEGPGLRAAGLLTINPLTTAVEGLRQLNAAAISLSGMTDRATVKAYLTQLIGDIRSFIKQLDMEVEGRNAGVNVSASNLDNHALPQSTATISPQRSTNGRNKGKESSSLAQRPRWR